MRQNSYKRGACAVRKWLDRRSMSCSTPASLPAGTAQPSSASRSHTRTPCLCGSGLLGFMKPHASFQCRTCLVGERRCREWAHGEAPVFSDQAHVAPWCWRYVYVVPPRTDRVLAQGQHGRRMFHLASGLCRAHLEMLVSCDYF